MDDRAEHDMNLANPLESMIVAVQLTWSSLGRLTALLQFGGDLSKDLCDLGFDHGLRKGRLARAGAATRRHESMVVIAKLIVDAAFA